MKGRIGWGKGAKEESE